MSQVTEYVKTGYVTLEPLDQAEIRNFIEHFELLDLEKKKFIRTELVNKNHFLVLGTLIGGERECPCCGKSR